MEESKKISCGPASIFDLKAELFKRKESLKQAKLERKFAPSVRVHNQKSSIWQKQNKGVHERASKDAEEANDDVDVDDQLKKSRAALEKKAVLYDRLTKRDVIPGDEENELYLVNFQKKVVDAILQEKKEKNSDSSDVHEKYDISSPCEPDEEWVDYTDSLGRSRHCLRKDLPELLKMDKNLYDCKKNNLEKEEQGKSKLITEDDLRRKQQREQWEKEEEEARNKPVGPVHYQNVLYNEIRNHGTSYFAFSTTEEKRTEQMDTLNNLRQQTITQREIREKLKQKRKTMLEERLAKVRQRKNLKLEEESQVKNEEPDVQVCSESMETKDCDHKPEPAVSPKTSKVRPWDIGKDLSETVNLNQDLKYRMSERDYIAQRRGERVEEFAPPSMYFESNARSIKKQQQKKMKHKNSSPFTTNVNVSTILLPDQNVTSSLSTENNTKEQTQKTTYQSSEDVQKIISETLAYFRAQSSHCNE